MQLDGCDCFVSEWPCELTLSSGAPATSQRPNHQPPSAQQKAQLGCLAFWIGRVLAQQRCERGQNGPLKHFKIDSVQRKSAHAQKTGLLPPQRHAPKKQIEREANEREICNLRTPR